MATCPICKFEIRVHEQPGYRAEFCSEFCGTTTQAEKEKFLALKEGELGLYPCSECGVIIEDEYHPGGICSQCGKLKSAALDALQLVVANLRHKLEVLGNTGMPVDGVLRLSIDDVKEFQKWPLSRIREALKDAESSAKQEGREDV
jgi:hypothetical protein